MNVLTIEQSEAAYWADFAFYGTTIVVLAVTLVVDTPQAQWPKVAFLAITGVVGWSACALSLAVLSGYVAYATMHHAIHYWRAKSAWLRRRQRWHFFHHNAQRPCCYGVMSGIWDTACRSTRPDRKSTADAASD
jgi:hypothetical protein